MSARLNHNVSNSLIQFQFSWMSIFLFQKLNKQHFYLETLTPVWIVATIGFGLSQIQCVFRTCLIRREITVYIRWDIERIETYIGWISYIKIHPRRIIWKRISFCVLLFWSQLLRFWLGFDWLFRLSTCMCAHLISSLSRLQPIRLHLSIEVFHLEHFHPPYITVMNSVRTMYRI